MGGAPGQGLALVGFEYRALIEEENSITIARPYPAMGQSHLALRIPFVPPSSHVSPLPTPHPRPSVPIFSLSVLFVFAVLISP